MLRMVSAEHWMAAAIVKVYHLSKTSRYYVHILGLDVGPKYLEPGDLRVQPETSEDCAEPPRRSANATARAVCAWHSARGPTKVASKRTEVH